jgi:5-methylcytosine-specific restriction endonuclease McrA
MLEKDQLVAFGERVLVLLDQGSFVATYKYAVLLALMDLCLEKTRRDGSAPESVTTRQLAEKVVELYWPQTAEFAGRTLRQNTGAQARIIRDICQFRDTLDDPSVSLHQARFYAAPRFDRLVCGVEWTLILMPLPRLQVVGGEPDRLLYDISWGVEIARAKRAVTDYQTGGLGAFDNNIRLLPGVGDHLVALNGLLRPLVHRAWSAMVAQLNGLHESRLEAFLFGVNRSALAAIRQPLLEIQRGTCFYCGRLVRRCGHVDHFIPWSRYPDNGIHNLVVADERCNRWKRDFLAARQHVLKWRRRNTEYESALLEVAGESKWVSHPDDTLGVARGIYLRLPTRARLWSQDQEFCLVGPEPLEPLLA